MSSTPLAPVSVDGRQLYAAPDGHLARDLDLAAWAELVQPRAIRRTIKLCIDDGLIQGAPIGGSTNPANNAACFRTYTEMVISGKGKKEETTVYYLSEEAALHVLMRLRTPKAVQAQKVVVRTFLLASKGILPDRAPMPPATSTPSSPDDRAARLLEIARELPAGPDRNGVLLGAAALLGVVRPAAARAPVSVATPSSGPADAAQAGVPATPGEEIPPSWVSASTIAARASAVLGRRVSANAVGRALAKLGYHEDGVGSDVRRGLVVDRPHGDGECVVWRYAPAVAETVLSYLRTARRRPALPVLASSSPDSTLGLR